MNCYGFARWADVGAAALATSRLIQTPTGESFKRVIVQIPLAQFGTFVIIGRNIFKGDPTTDLARAAALTSAVAVPSTPTLNAIVVIGQTVAAPAAPMNPPAIYQEIHFQPDEANQIFVVNVFTAGTEHVNLCGEVYR